MKYKGIARRAGLKLILLMLAAVAVVGLLGKVLGWAGTMAEFLGGLVVWVAGGLAVVWFLFAVFTVYFFRDPDANTPGGPGLVVSPGHGKIDAIEKMADSQFPGGPCHRISMFLSVIDVHVQNAPVSGKIACVNHTAGQFLNAMEADSARRNENVLIGFDSTEVPGEKIGVRLIAGVLARRIIPFVAPGEELKRGDRMSLIQFGSRCDVYLPLAYQVKVKLGDKVVGGESILASKS